MLQKLFYEYSVLILHSSPEAGSVLAQVPFYRTLNTLEYVHSGILSLSGAKVLV